MNEKIKDTWIFLLPSFVITGVLAIGFLLAVVNGHRQTTLKVSKACVDGVSYIYRYEVLTLQVDVNNKPVGCLP